MKKRIISLTIALIIVFSYGSAKANAASSLSPTASSPQQQIPSTPGFSIDYGVVARFSEPQEFVDYLKTALENMRGYYPDNAALRDIAAYTQEAISRQAVSEIAAARNNLTLTGRNIAQSVEAARRGHAGLMGVLSENGVALNRPIAITARVAVQNLRFDETILVTLEGSVADTLGGDSVMLMLGDARHAITVTGDALRAITDQHGALTLQIGQMGGGAFSITFMDGGGNIIIRLPSPITVTLPASGMFDTVFADFGVSIENWGGRYDETASALHFPTPYSGTYEVMGNLYSISDITSLTDEMQRAVQFMVSKGFFELDAGQFDPRGTVSRYDFSETLVRMFYALDRNLTTSFSDVPLNSRYYPYIASGERTGLIGGVGDGLFAGERTMTRQEAVTLAARALANQKGYEYPANPDDYIAAFSDAGDISEWAHITVSLAAREGIIGTGGSFAPRRDITRAEAATILYRLFLLLYETPPVAVEIRPLSPGGGSGGRNDDSDRESRRQADPEEEDAPESWPREEGAPSSTLPLATGISIIVIVACAGTAAVIIIIRKNKSKPQW